MKRLLIFASHLVLVVTTPAQSDALEKWESTPGHCPAGIHSQPNGPFAIILFCEDALGAYLAVTYIKPIGAPLTQNGRWSLKDRYWHESVWGSDVTGFQWSKDKKKLLVSTQQVYGSGGFFELDLLARTFNQRLPKGATISIENPGPGYNINGVILGEPKQ